MIDRRTASVDRESRQLRIVHGDPLEEAALLATGRGRLPRIGRGWRSGRRVAEV